MANSSSTLKMRCVLGVTTSITLLFLDFLNVLEPESPLFTNLILTFIFMIKRFKSSICCSYPAQDVFAKALQEIPYTEAHAGIDSLSRIFSFFFKSMTPTIEPWFYVTVLKDPPFALWSLQQSNLKCAEISFLMIVTGVARRKRDCIEGLEICSCSQRNSPGIPLTSFCQASPGSGSFCV